MSDAAFARATMIAATRPIKEKYMTITKEEAPGFVRNGIVSINEVRQQMGLKPIVGGDVHFIATDIAVICVSDLVEVPGDEYLLDVEKIDSDD